MSEFSQEALWVDLETWQQGVPRNERTGVRFAAAPEAGGLPAGWTVRHTHFEPRVPGRPLMSLRDYYLVQRAAGGWAVVYTFAQHRKTQMWRADGWNFDHIAATLPDMYTEGITLGTNFMAGVLAHDYLATLYDPTDLVEAAERLVVALGGPISRMPAAALL